MNSIDNKNLFKKLCAGTKDSLLLGLQEVNKILRIPKGNNHKERVLNGLDICALLLPHCKTLPIKHLNFETAICSLLERCNTEDRRFNEIFENLKNSRKEVELLISYRIFTSQFSSEDEKLVERTSLKFQEKFNLLLCRETDFKLEYFQSEESWNPCLDSKGMGFEGYLARHMIIHRCVKTFEDQFLYCYSLICQEEYLEAKNRLKALCSRADSCPKRLHICNLLAFCHLYMAEYVECLYYLDLCVKMSHPRIKEAFELRKKVLSRLSTSKKLNTAGKSDFVIILKELKECGLTGIYKADCHKIMKINLNEPKMAKVVYNLLTKNFINKRIVLNILLGSSSSILREIIYEPNSFYEDTILPLKEITRKNNCELEFILNLEKHLRSLIPENCGFLYSFYLINSELWINNYQQSLTIETSINFSEILNKYNQILEDNKKSFLITESIEFWKLRYTLDGILKTLIDSINLKIEFSDVNFILLDNELFNFPVDNLPCLRKTKRCRIPCLSYLSKFKKGPNCETKHAKEDSFYLLDPMNNLKCSQERLIPLLNGMNGVTGRLLDTKERLELFKSENVLYFGHGNGYKYLYGDSACTESRNKSILLFGCSSARIKSVYNFKRNGVVLNYLKNANFLFGCLWDITDKDIDKVAACLLTDGVINSSVCKLKYLNGAALVIYGFPT